MQPRGERFEVKQLQLRILRKRSRIPFTVMLCTALLFGVTACSSPAFATLGSAKARALPQPAVGADGTQLVWGQDVKASALTLIQQSRKFVYLEMYELSDPDILLALAQAHQRGIDVRVIVDATEQHSTKVGYPKLQSDAVLVRKLSVKRGIDHVKMLITDQGVLIGGMNFGANSWNNNDGSVLIPKSPNLSSAFQTMFTWDFARARGQAAQAPVVSFPLVYDRSIENAELTAIQSAHKSIRMEAFDLSDRDVTNALKAAINRGVSVTVLVDPNEAQYSRTSMNTLQNAGATTRYYKSYQGELMHAKILDVDGGETFIIGSANFSHQAYTYNHEADVVLHNVPSFDQALEKDLSTEIARGTEYPTKVKN